MADVIMSKAPDVLLLGGDANFLPICQVLRDRGSKTKVILTWHSYPSSHSFLPQDANLFAKWMKALDDNLIDRIGFVRPRFHKIFRDPRYVYFPNRTPSVRPLPEGYRPGFFATELGPHFGAISTCHPWKNVEGALLIAGSYPGNPMVHTIKTETRPLLTEMGIRVMEHPYQDQRAFHRLLGSMDLNLLLSFGEAYNMTFMESWMLGVPCITSTTTDLHPELAFTQVSSYDDPDVVWAKMQEVLENPRVAFVQKILKELDDHSVVVVNKVLGEL
jgi:glycosyltransferase involved in cell wall biosynthesis